MSVGMKHENSVEEIWRVREQLSAEEGYDVHRLFERLRREQVKYSDRLVHAVPRLGAEASSTGKQPPR